MVEQPSFRGLVKEYVGHKKKVQSVAWNCTGRKLATGSVDQSARVWSVDAMASVGRSSESQRSDSELKGHTDSVDQLCWDPVNESTLATASCDKSVRFWDVRSGKCSQTVATPGENINITWSPDGKYLAVGSRDDQISFLDARKMKASSSIQQMAFSHEVNEIGWSKDSAEFYATTGQGSIEVFSFPQLAPVKTLRAHTAGCYCIAFDPTGACFAAGSADALVSIWDVRDKVCLQTLPRLDWPVRTLSFSHDGQLLASAAEDHAIDIAYVATGALAHRLPVRSAINSLAWNPCHHLLAYAGDDVQDDNADSHHGFSGSKRTHVGSVFVWGFKSS